MAKSATDVMQEIIFSAVIDSITALKAASKGLPNTLLRDLNAVHANTTFADLPKELQDAIGGNVRAAFARLLKEGYSVAGGEAKAPARPRPQGQPNGERPRQPPRPRQGDKRGTVAGKPPGGRGDRPGKPRRG